MKRFDDEYGYSIQWGYIWARDEHFWKCVTFHFLTKHIFKNMSQCRHTPYSGTLETPLGVPWDNMDLPKIKIWILNIPMAKAGCWLMLYVTVPEKSGGTLTHFRGTLRQIWGTLRQIWGTLRQFWGTLRQRLKVPHPDWPHIWYHSLCVGCIQSKPLYISY